MYEYDVYADARRTIPRLREPLQTIDGEYFLIKIDPLAGTMSFSTSKNTIANLTTLPISRVKEIIALNRAGEKAETLEGNTTEQRAEEPTYRQEEDSITRFDNKSKRNKRNKRKGDKGDKGDKGVRSESSEGESGAENRAEGGEQSTQEPKEPRETKERRQRPRRPEQPKSDNTTAATALQADKQGDSNEERGERGERRSKGRGRRNGGRGERQRGDNGADSKE